MTTAALTPSHRIRQAEYFALFFVLEAAVFAILPLSARPGWLDTLLIIQAALAGVFLAAAYLLQRAGRAANLSGLLYIFFAISLALIASTLWQDDLIGWLGLRARTPVWAAAIMLSQSILRVGVVLALLLLARADFRSIYLSAGRLKTGLGIGAAGFAVLAAGGFLASGQTADALLDLLPWILVYVFANAFSEELLYRGLLLKRYEAYLGRGLANLLAAVVFTLVHMQATYVPDVVQFLLVTFPLALVWGWLMQKSGSLWGSVLFHAGADCVIIFGIFAGL